VRLPGGGVVEVGSWAPASDDQTAWAVRVDAAASAEEVVLSVPGGAVWATATVR
jgi:hypothetical protein